MKESQIKESFLKLVNDIIVGSRTIRSYAWELHYLQKVKEIRKKEFR